MMDEKQKRQVADRLNRIEGQIRGVKKMLEEDRYCMDILAQTRAIVAAIRKVEDKVMEQHLSTCVVDAVRSEDSKATDTKLTEIMDVLTKYRQQD